MINSITAKQNAALSSHPGGPSKKGRQLHCQRVIANCGELSVGNSLDFFFFFKQLCSCGGHGDGLGGSFSSNLTP